MDFKDTLTLDEAVRLSTPKSFNLMIKPAGSLCNLDCHYCYYLDKAEIYGGREPRMSLDMLEKVIKEFIAANEVPEVTFNWHGGEPLVCGLEFYRKAVEFQQKYADGKKILNTIQTNATLVDRPWAEFFRANDFLVGVSIDGPKDVHDRYRKDKGGFPTFERVVRGIEQLYRAGVKYNTMTTVNHCSEGRGLEIYAFLKSLGTRYMQFMPVVEHVKQPMDSSGKVIKSARPYIVDPCEEGAKIAPWSVSSIAYGKFLCDIFDYWVCNDVGKFFVNQFDATLASVCGAVPGTCVYAETCGGNAIIEHNGDIYPCDHFVYSKYVLGNICEQPLDEIMNSQAQRSFGLSKRNSLPRKCSRCKYYRLCRGECPKHRFNRTEAGETGLNALCEGYFKFYSHTEPFFLQMRDLLQQRRPAVHVIPWARKRLSSF